MKHIEGFYESNDKTYIPFNVREYTPMSVGEFISKVRNGERELSGIGLYSEDSSPIINLMGHERYEDLLDYLNGVSEEEFEEDPIQLNDSYLKNLRAPGLKMPHVEAEHSVLDFSYLFRGGNFRGGNFSGADMRAFIGNNSDFTHAVLSDAEAQHSSWVDATLNDLNVDDANVSEADFSRSEHYGVDWFRARGFKSAEYDDAEPNIVKSKGRKGLDL